ncbi:MAG: hypothetical protein ABFD90_02215 [Phycisphaerales bacterium]
MAKVPVHFMGFLGNLVDDSVTKLQLGEGFMIESGSPSDVRPFLSALHSYWGERGGRDIWPEGRFRVVKRNIAEFDATGRGGVAADPTVGEKAHIFVHDKLRLLRLFKEGNVVLPYSFLYYINESQPDPFCLRREYPIADRTPFTLTPTEVPEAQSFIDAVSLPLRESSLQLAFENFDLSYEVHDTSLAFLSLMIALEILLYPKDSHGEITHQISRNAAVLLGGNRQGAQDIFRDMKRLYGTRSALVHTGDRSSVARQDVLDLRQYVRQTIKEAMSSRMSKDELLKMLNACGFGQRPWKESAE